MLRSKIRRSSSPSRDRRGAVEISRRQLLAGAGAGAAALFLEARGAQAQAPRRTVVFAHTTVVNVDAVQNDVALAVDGDRIAAIGPTDAILRTYPQSRLRRAGKAPGPDQLSRPSGNARPRLQRDFRIPQLRPPGDPPATSSGRRPR
jgi:hypothetical protein